MRCIKFCLGDFSCKSKCHLDMSPSGSIRLRLECGIVPGAINVAVFPNVSRPRERFGRDIGRLTRSRVILSEHFGESTQPLFLHTATFAVFAYAVFQWILLIVAKSFYFISGRFFWFRLKNSRSRVYFVKCPATLTPGWSILLSGMF